jgi:hypothetical protein
MCVAGKKVFVGIGATAEIQVFDKENGEYLGSLKPGPEVGSQSGWIDIPYGVTAYLRKNGEYIVVVEEDGRCKNIVYRLKTNDAGPDWRETVGPGPDSVIQAPSSASRPGELRASRYAGSRALAPADNSIRFDSPGTGVYSVEISDAEGRIIAARTGQIERQIDIPFAHVPGGIYVARVMVDSRMMYTTKIVRQ